MHFLVVRRPRDDFGRGTAQHDIRRDVPRDVERRQRVVVRGARGLVGAERRRIRRRAAVVVAGAFDVGVHEAHAEVAAHAVTAEVRLRVGRIGFLRQRVGVVEVRRGVRRRAERAAEHPVHDVVEARLDVMALIVGETREPVEDVGVAVEADRGEIAGAHAADDVERAAFVVLVVAIADQQLVDPAVEVLAPVDLAVDILRLGRPAAVVAAPAAARRVAVVPVGRIRSRSGIVERDAVADVPRVAAVVVRLDERLRVVVVVGLAVTGLSAEMPAVARCRGRAGRCRTSSPSTCAPGCPDTC